MFAGTKAEVCVIKIHKIERIHQTYLAEHLTSNQHAACRAIVHRPRFVKFRRIDLIRSKVARRTAHPTEISTRSPDSIRLLEIHYFGDYHLPVVLADSLHQ